MGQFVVIPAKNLNATQATESFCPVYEELHSDPGNIIETITAYFKKWELLEQKPKSRKKKLPFKQHHFFGESKELINN